MLWNLRDRDWDKQLCSWQGVPMSMLPEARPSGSEYGLIEASLLGKALPILAVAGDQQAALLWTWDHESGRSEVHLWDRSVPALPCRT